MPRCACNPQEAAVTTCCNCFCCATTPHTIANHGESAQLISRQPTTAPFTEKQALLAFDKLVTTHASTTCGADWFCCTAPPEASNAFPATKQQCCGSHCGDCCVGCNRYCALHFHCQTWNKLLHDSCEPRMGIFTAKWIMLFAAGTSSITGPAGILHPEDYHDAGCHHWLTGGKPCHDLNPDWGWDDRFTAHKANIILGVCAGLSSAGIKFRGAPDTPEHVGHCYKSCITNMLPNTEGCTHPKTWSSFVMLCSLLGGLSSGGLSYIGLLGLSSNPAVATTGAAANCCASTFLGCHSFDKLKDTKKQVTENQRWTALVFGTIWGMTAIVGKIGLAADVIVHYMHGYYLAALAAGVASNIAFGILLGIAVFRIITYVNDDIKQIIDEQKCSPSIAIFLCCSFAISTIGCFDYGGLNNIVFDKLWPGKNMPYLSGIIKRLLAFLTGMPRGMLIEMSLLKVFKEVMQEAPKLHQKYQQPGSLPVRPADLALGSPEHTQQPGTTTANHNGVVGNSTTPV